MPPERSRIHPVVLHSNCPPKRGHFSELFADGSSISYNYVNPATNTLSTQLYSTTDSSGTTTYTYNNLDELTSETTPNTPTVACPAPNTGITASTCYGYDAAGNLVSKTDGGGTVSYGYDPTNQVTSVTDRQGQPYSIGYSQDGEQNSIGFPNGVTEAMTYDAAGQLTNINATKGGSTLTNYSYSYTKPNTSTVTTVPYSATDTSGTTTNYTYDGNNQLTGYTKPTMPAISCPAPNTGTTASVCYGHDNAGNLTSVAASGTSTSFTYNAAGELTSASGGLNTTYGYDGNGDRTSVTVQGQTSSQAINVNTAGQITSITPPGGSAIPYSYTGVGEQQRIGAGSNGFRYDGTGLSKQTDSVGDTYYTSLPDGTLLAETIPAGDPTCPSPGSPCSYYYLSDGAGSVAAVTDSTGAVKNTYAYDPLGNATSTGNVPNSFTFDGWIFDSQTGYYYTGSGYYDPATGQSFGCTDKGPNDAPGSEDFCGEDEAPYDDSFYTARFPFVSGGPGSKPVGGGISFTVYYFPHHRVSVAITVTAPTQRLGGSTGLVANVFGAVAFGGDDYCEIPGKPGLAPRYWTPTKTVTCNVRTISPFEHDGRTVGGLGVHLTGVFGPLGGYGRGAKGTRALFFQTVFFPEG